MSIRNKRPTLHSASRIGIVNRGEPAVRLIRAVREYNAEFGTDLASVAIYLDAESDAVFVREADVAVPLRSIPGATQEGSVYLNHDVLVAALEYAKCDAVWPGWGFVSEDATFATIVRDHGIVFLGPSPEAMSLLGDKIAAKELAERSDVPILPWSRRPVENLDDARSIAEDIGYPVIVKAAHAGGGRGIRFVPTPDEMESQYRSAREETLRVTGDEIVFIERLVGTGRHLEVQCLCDRHGTVNTYGVRDCSVQRRNQKVIEETPPAGMSQSETAEIESSAARLMEAAEYEGAGTVEFLYDLERNEYYFMEVNTRLQVEHPITEELFGVDLVKGQLRVAFGERLASPSGPALGAVVEARLNAEDPARDFAPSPGEVVFFRPPAGPGIRIDSGVERGSVIPALFDSMVAKVIAGGSTRGEAHARLRRALAETRISIEGGTTNKAFLLELLSRPEIRDGGVHTRYVEEYLARRSAGPGADGLLALVAAAITSYNREEQSRLQQFRQQVATYGFPRARAVSGRHEASFRFGGNAYDFAVMKVGPTNYELEVDETKICANYIQLPTEGRLIVGDRRVSVQTVLRGDALQCELDGIPFLIEQESGGAVKAPSPAIVLSLSANVGDTVHRGDRLLSLEAMKMEMRIDAPSDGVVSEVLVSPGQQVSAGQSLVLMETSGEAGTEDSSGRVDFTLAAPTPDQVTVCREVRLAAVFLGYDVVSDPTVELDNLIKMAEQSADAREHVSALICRLLDTYVRVASIFSSEQIRAENFARTVSWLELAFIYFRYDMHDTDALPEQFREGLKSALSLYPHVDSKDGEWVAFFHMQRSRRYATQRAALLRQMILALEGLPVPVSRSGIALDLLDSVVRLNQIVRPALADVALHARYRLYDSVAIRNVRQRRAERTRQKLETMLALAADDPARASLEQDVIDSSPHIVGELLQAYATYGEEAAPQISDLIARYMVRDRECSAVEINVKPARPVAVVSGDGFRTALVVGSLDVDTIDSLFSSAESVLAATSATGPRAGESADTDIIVLATASEECEVNSLFAEALGHPVDAGRCAIGIYRPGVPAEYRTYHHAPEWCEDERRRYFSPLLYRELRVERLSRFDFEVLYHSDEVYLLAASANENPKDERLFALAAASESQPEINRSGNIERVSEFDEVFMEAVFKLRSEQASRSRRLFWNRIIVHVRALIPATANQIKEYGDRIVPSVREIGLEKVVVLSRRKRWSEDRVRELELLFLNISGDHFTLRSRKPSTEPLKPMDRYVSNIVRSRQRNTVYPYELIKMITYTGYPVSVEVPRGDFEEFDLDPDGVDRPAVSVKGRKYGLNDSNVVFGIVRNADGTSETGFRRVLVLSDSTSDMGSLAEPECRRVIAAIDLAEKERLPVEWVPISSGARIDMESGTENLDWTAAVLRRIVEFTQSGGEINVIVSGINVGAQSYWNAEATMLMHTRGLLIMTDDASMLLTGKKALDFSGSVSADSNQEIGGVERIMGPNGQAQVRVATLSDAYRVLFQHYRYTYVEPGAHRPIRRTTADPASRNVGESPYNDRLGQGFRTIGDIFSAEQNPERKKPFDMRQVMEAVIDSDAGYLERWAAMQDGETAITWETRIGGFGVGLIGIESRALARLSDIPHDGPDSWSGGTLFPHSSRKVARAINAWSSRVPVVVLANLSGFDGSPESLRRLQLEYGAEIGRAVVNFDGPIVFVVVARYHGGAYVVFSRSLNPNLTAFALTGSYASVLGGAPAAAVVFPRQVEKEMREDDRYREASRRLQEDPSFSRRDFDEVRRAVYAEKQSELGRRFDTIHSVERARDVGSIDRIIDIDQLRPIVISTLEDRYKPA